MLDYLIVAAFVVIAATYLFLHFRSSRKKHACAKCGDAPQH
ncbi:MAG: hypothetical protein U1F27_17160 [Turneriella sp.]